MFKINQIKKLDKKDSIGKYIPKLISCLEILSIDKSEQTQKYLDVLNQHIQPFILNQETETEIKYFPVILSEVEVHSVSILTDKYSALKEKIEEYPTKITELRNILEKLEERFQNEFTNIDSVIDIKKRELESLNNTIVEKDKVRIEKFKKDFTEVEKKIWSEWEEEKRLIDAAHKEQISAFQKIKKDEVENSEKIRTAAEKTLQYFGITKEVFETGGFLIAAKNESEQANKLRWLAIALMILIAVSVLAISILVKPKEATDFVFRFLTIFTLMIPAGYAAREASRHRTNSEMYRLAGTEMSTLDQFLSGLDDKDKAGVRKELVAKYFGHFRFVGEKGSSAGVDDLLTMLEKVLKSKNKSDSKNNKENFEKKES